MTEPQGRIPATIVTGFLGAGKTTLIRHLIENAGGRRLALIVNEFGERGFDGGLLADCESPACGRGNIVELSNGCICCTVADDFLPAIEALLARSDPPDHIVIETSGLALPQPLVKAFAWPSVRERTTVDGVVTIVDAAALAEGRIAPDETGLAAQRAADPALDHESPVDELFEDQLRCADLIVVSKVDLVDAPALARVEGIIGRDARPQARMVRAAHGALPAEVFLGLHAGAESDSANRLSHHEMEGEGDHEHDDFTSFSFSATPPDRPAAEERVRAAMAVEGVLRIKGTMMVDGKPAPLAVQAVGPRVETWFARPQTVAPRLVVIGLRDLDRGAVERALRG